MVDEVKNLIIQAQKGSREAMGELVKRNSGLIYKEVRRFADRAESDDLFQIGAIGLMKAVRRFDLNYDVELSTYAVPMIAGEIKRFLRDDGIIKVSRRHKELASRAYSLMERTGETALLALADKLEVSPEELTEALEASRRPDSIDRKISDGDGKNMSLMDTIPAESGEEGILMRLSLQSAIMNLTPRERQIIILRYFKDETQSGVAKRLGLSQVQISRIEKKVLEKIRQEIS